MAAAATAPVIVYPWKWYPQRNLKTVKGLVARLSVVEYDIHAASHTGEVRAVLAKAGTSIDPYDVMIAGQARSRGFTLVANNEREFNRVDGLRVANWSK